jgi:hypothetical protein
MVNIAPIKRDFEVAFPNKDFIPSSDVMNFYGVADRDTAEQGKIKA